MPAPNWYPDPQRRYLMRYWNSSQWTTWVSDGQDTWSEADDPRVEFVTRLVLPEAVKRGIIEAAQAHAIEAAARDMSRVPMAASGHGPVSPQVERSPGAAHVPVPHSGIPVGTDEPVTPRPWDIPTPTGTGNPTNGEHVPVANPGVGWAPGAPGSKPIGPGGYADGREVRPSTWNRFWSEVSSELALRGLTYLGVLLLFVGLFGLVAFAFADVAPFLRPVAEIGAVAVPLLAAVLLRRQGIPSVSRAMEGLAGLLAGVMAITSLADSVDIPPDPHGAFTTPVLVAALLAVALVLWLWTRRMPDTGARWAIAPVLWLAAAMAVIGVGRPIPIGQDVAQPSLVQVAAMAVAMAVVAVLARNSSSPWAEGTRLATLPGTVVVLAMAVLTPMAGPWAVLPWVLALLGLVVAWDHSAARVPGGVTDVVVVLGMSLAILRLVNAPVSGIWMTVMAATAVVISLAVSEVVGRRRRSPLAQMLATAVSGAALLGVSLGADSNLWVSVLLAGSVTVWAVWVRPRGNMADNILLVIAHMTIFAVLLIPTPHLEYALMAAAVSSLAFGVVAHQRWRVRDGQDQFWIKYWWVNLGISGLLFAPGVTLSQTGLPGTPIFAYAAVAIVAVAVYVGPWRSGWHIPTATTLLWFSWYLATIEHEGLRPWVAVLPIIGAGVMTFLAQRRDSLPWAAAAHGSAVVALLLASLFSATDTLGIPVSMFAAISWSSISNWSIAGAWAGLAAVWGITARGSDRGIPPWRRLLGKANSPYSAAISWTLSLVTGAASVTTVIDLTQVLPTWGLGLAVVPMVVSLIFAAATWLPWRGWQGADALVPASLVLAVFGVLGAWDGIGNYLSLIISLAIVFLLPIATSPHRRMRAAAWAAWLAFFPMLAFSAMRWGPAGWWFEAFNPFIWVGVTAGGLAVIGGLLTDGVHPRRRYRLRTAAMPPTAIGAMWWLGGTFIAGTFAGYEFTRELALILAISGILLAAIGALMALPPVIVAAIWLSWIALQVLSGDLLGNAAQLGIAVGLLAIALAVSVICARRPNSCTPRSLRPDSWLAYAAVPMWVLAVSRGLVSTADGDLLIAAMGGLLAGAVAWRVHRNRVISEALGALGAFVLISAGMLSGPGWAAGGFAAVGLVHSVLAVVAPRRSVTWLRSAVGVALLVYAWSIFLHWLGLEADGSYLFDLVASTVVVWAVAAFTRYSKGKGTGTPPWIPAWLGGAAILALFSWPMFATRPDSLWATFVLLLLGIAIAMTNLRGSAVIATIPIILTLQQMLGFMNLEATAEFKILFGLSAIAMGVQAAGLVSRMNRWRLAAAIIGTELLALSLWTSLVGGFDASALLLAGLAAQLFTLGWTWNILWLQMAAPAVAWLGWIRLIDTHDLAVGLGWYTGPVGAVLLLQAALRQWDLRRRDEPSSARGIVGLELAGMSFLVGGPLIESMYNGVAHALVAAGISAAILIWGLIGHVRWRLIAGAIGVLVGVVFAVVLPLVQVLPAWGGAGLWVGVAVLGLVVVGAATFAEKGRDTAREVRSKFEDLTDGWQ